MKLSFAFYDLSNYLKIQNGRHFWDFTFIREALRFCGSYKLTGQFYTSLYMTIFCKVGYEIVNNLWKK